MIKQILLVDYPSDALKRYSEMCLTPVDVLFVTRTLKIKPAEGRKGLRMQRNSSTIKLNLW